MALTIRKAVIADAAEMANIHIRSWEVAYAGIIPDEAICEKNAGRLALWQKVLSGGHDNYITLDGETPVGLMGIHPCRDDDLSSTGEALLKKWRLLLSDFDESLNIVQSIQHPDQTIRIGCLTQQIHNKKISQILEHCSNSGADIFMDAQDLKYLHVQLINRKYDVIISYAFDIIDDNNIQSIPICKADLYLVGTARVFEDDTSRGYSKLLLLSRSESKNSAERVMYVCRQMGYDFKYVNYYPNIASLEFSVRQGEGAMVGGDYILKDGDALLGIPVPKELDDNHISMAWLAETNKKCVMDFISSVKRFIKVNKFDI